MLSGGGSYSVSPYKHPHAFSPLHPSHSADPYRLHSPPRATSPGATSTSNNNLLKDHYDHLLHTFELHSRERLLALRESLTRLHSDLDLDDVIRALREDPSSAHFAHQRMREICDNHIIAEGEKEIQQLRAENLIVREALVKFEQNAAQRQMQANNEEVEARIRGITQKKDRYKAVAG